MRLHTRDRPSGGNVHRVLAMLAVGVALACSVASTSSPNRYRLRDSADAGSGTAVPADLLERYPDFFAVVMNPDDHSEPDLLALRDDLERNPVSRANYDALNSLALAYFAMNRRAESDRGGTEYLQDSFRAAKLIAVPWRAYGATPDPLLRGAILDFFEDIADGDKLHSARTAARVSRVVGSLEKKESDPGRIARIQELTQRLSQSEQQTR